ncbi:hypothetical protein BDV06DRAFT_229206 [Aspergillus oleicola]
MDSIEEERYRSLTVRTDIGELGAAFYSAITGKRCDFDVYKDHRPSMRFARWPQRSDLPSTEGLWLGSIIEKCFSRGFKNARELEQALEEYPEDGERKAPSRARKMWQWSCKALANNSVPVLMCFSAMAMFARWAVGFHKRCVPAWNITVYEHYF